MSDKYDISYDRTNLECADYQPIQTMRNSIPDDSETTEDAGCDSCVRYKKGQCEIYIK